MGELHPSLWAVPHFKIFSCACFVFFGTSIFLCLKEWGLCSFCFFAYINCQKFLFWLMNNCIWETVSLKMKFHNWSWGFFKKKGSLPDEVILLNTKFSNKLQRFQDIIAIQENSAHMTNLTIIFVLKRKKWGQPGNGNNSPSHLFWWGWGRRRCPHYQFLTEQRSEGWCCDWAGRP